MISTGLPTYHHRCTKPEKVSLPATCFRSTNAQDIFPEEDLWFPLKTQSILVVACKSEARTILPKLEVTGSAGLKKTKEKLENKVFAKKKYESVILTMLVPGNTVEAADSPLVPPLPTLVMAEIGLRASKSSSSSRASSSSSLVGVSLPFSLQKRLMFNLLSKFGSVAAFFIYSRLFSDLYYISY